MRTKLVIRQAAIIGLTSAMTVFLLNGGKADWFDIIGTIAACLLGVFVVVRMQKKQS
ncbi:hypothetical protein MOC41_03770 [Bacillus spizizenii]|uniref:hypothetical protein n=1 Tax=Bacillus spizizenii TaxID=96241 RepID=UPI0005CAA9A1|nr:hypothetical protein [Bacillus spizizenii]MCY7874729.1 hypothetical protein [Bacillus spizizenii]MCY7958715.1 hypothetical protein [Bacillus spizizenii]MCY7970527.1 hypothetical protein [Bacillus spizizenii]MCY7987045.1 hypothetical protein [Bacillus spizizenii]MCY7995565.1 hypothetical protein [Bacillus spizizenii]